jgi:hypothetical protein
MGDVIPFVTREAYDAAKMSIVRENGSELSAQEIQQKLTDMAFGEISSLISKFRGTGRWNPSAEKHMRAAIDNIVKVCAAVAGVGK